MLYIISVFQISFPLLNIFSVFCLPHTCDIFFCSFFSPDMSLQVLKEYDLNKHFPNCRTRCHVPKLEAGEYLETLILTNFAPFKQHVNGNIQGHFLIENVAVHVLRKLGTSKRTQFGRAVTEAYRAVLRNPAPTKTGLQQLATMLADPAIKSFGEWGIPNRLKDVEVVGVPIGMFLSALAREGFTVKKS